MGEGEGRRKVRFQSSIGGGGSGLRFSRDSARRRGGAMRRGGGGGRGVGKSGVR